MIRLPQVFPYAASMLLVLAAGISSAVHAGILYADNTLGSNCVATYNPATRACQGGTAAAYATLAAAANAAMAGDTVYVRGGTHSERLIPPRSGNAGAYITFQAYNAESATLSGISDVAIFLQNRSYLIIDGLRVDDVTGWARLEDSNNNIIRNCRFSRATSSGTTGGIKLVRSGHNRISGNTIEDGNDSIVIQESDRNLILDNVVTTARHSLFSLRCGNFNVIRGNTFTNVDQKAGEIYDCEGSTSDAPIKLDATNHNLVEGNRFTYTKASSANYYYNGIQYAGQYGLVRRNAFYDNQGGALNFQVYSDEALYNYGNRVFNNTFYNNRCSAIAASGNSTSARYQNNRAENNLFYKNVGCGGQAAQTDIGNTTAVVLANNAVLTTAPPFIDESGHDFRLAAGSGLIDAGAFLARTVGNGSGTTVPLTDVGYFYDGFGIAGELGDLVQLEGQTRTARVLGIDFVAKTLTLSQSLTWSDGQGIHPAFSGSRPDVGAYEFTSTSGKIPSRATNTKAVVNRP
jgi:parallel beta-helix repeat protein